MADTSGAAVAESDLEWVQRRIRKVDADLDRLEAKVNTERDEGKKHEIEVEIRENKVYHGKLLDEKRALEAKMGNAPAAPGACRLPRPRSFPLLPHRGGCC
jgi:hypothetical protein